MLVLTGAGVSADSGLATFRDAGGLWEGLRPEEVATPQAWAADPERVWGFYQARRAALLEAQPNPAHHALADFEQRVTSSGGSYLLVTQNVDDLHERAGSSRPVHMHGELARLACERCGGTLRDLESMGEPFVPCGDCGAPRLRPDVVWFGEVPHHLEEIGAALRACTHFLALGTSGAVWPAAGFLQEARSRGAATWIQALEEPDNLGPGDRFVAGRAAEVLPGLLAELAQEIESHAG